MKIKRILKWSALTIIVALFTWFEFAYWTSTNECNHRATPSNPMKAIIYCEYGSPDVLKFEDVEKPVPNDNQVLIKVRAASLNPVDGHLMRAPFPLRLMTGLRKPKKTLLDADVAGQVEAVGRNVKQFKPGDEVFGACPGAFAEYACARESAVAMKPHNVSF